MSWSRSQSAHSLATSRPLSRRIVDLLVLRGIEANVEKLAATSPRKRVMPVKMLPRPQSEMPMVYGVGPSYAAIAGLHISSGRFFDAGDGEAGAVESDETLEGGGRARSGRFARPGGV